MVSRAEDRSPADVWQDQVTVWVARDEREMEAGLAVTDREFPVSGSTALAEGTVSVCPAAASTVYGLLCEMLITGRRAVGPMRMHPYPKSSPYSPASSSLFAG